ncbi:hypothetical protein CC2G_013234 [Coprinopsis cinerea AmutBmut pab1-1]|nr:hypothetical protein CC2G_013234 [Coprinopsis cinerea AmutBmut pab1-1]
MTERPSNNSLLPPSIRKYLEESEEQIQAIKTVNDIKEVVGADAALLLVGERTPAICRLYATLVQEHERIIKEKFHLIGHYQALDASVTKFFEATQKVLDGTLKIRSSNNLVNGLKQSSFVTSTNSRMPLDKPNSFLLSIVDESISLPPYLLPLAITDQFPPWLPDRSPEATFLLSPTAWFDLCRRKNYARGMVIGATNVAKPDTGNATITPTNAPYAARMLPDTTLAPSGVPVTDQHLATFHPITCQFYYKYCHSVVDTPQPVIENLSSQLNLFCLRQRQASRT